MHLARGLLALTSLLPTATAWINNYIHAGVNPNAPPLGAPGAGVDLFLSTTGNFVIGPPVAVAERIPFRVPDYPANLGVITSPDGLGPGHLALAAGEMEGMFELVWESDSEAEAEEFVLTGCTCGGNCAGSCLKPPGSGEVIWMLDERGSGPEWKVCAWNSSVAWPGPEGFRYVFLWRYEV